METPGSAPTKPPGKFVGTMQIDYCFYCVHHRLQHEAEGCTQCDCPKKNTSRLPDRDAQA